jgi:adenylate cyclase
VWLVAVFVDMEGFTERSARLSLDVIEALVQAFVVSISAAARAERGVVMKLMGDGALVVFPAEDGAERKRAVAAAIRFAAQAVRMRMDTSQGAVPARLACAMRAGIASGVCSLGEWGAADVLDYSVIGLPVNLAARLQGAAPSGGLLIDLRTANLMESPTGPVTSLWLDGLGPVRAVRVAAG